MTEGMRERLIGLDDASVEVPLSTLFRWASTCSGASGFLQGINLGFVNSGMKAIDEEMPAELSAASAEIVSFIARASNPLPIEKE